VFFFFFKKTMFWIGEKKPNPDSNENLSTSRKGGSQGVPVLFSG